MVADVQTACYNLCLLAFETVHAGAVALDHSRVGSSVLDALVLLFALSLGPHYLLLLYVWVVGTSCWCFSWWCRLGSSAGISRPSTAVECTMHVASILVCLLFFLPLVMGMQGSQGGAASLPQLTELNESSFRTFMRLFVAYLQLVRALPPA